jgi:uncharacterized protein YjdB
VDGLLKTTGNSFTLNAADYTAGKHTLQVRVQDGSNKYWSKTIPFTVTVAVTNITLNKTTLNLPAGQSETLFAALSPSNAGNKDVIWSSSNPAVAVVGESGLVTAIALGSAVITVTAAEGGHTAACSVTVRDAGTGAISLRFNDAGEGAFSQDTFTLIQGGSPTSQTVYLVGWTTGEWRVDGHPKGSSSSFTVGIGDYTIGKHLLQVTVDDGSRHWSKTLPFTITAAVTGISLNKTSINMLAGQSATLVASLIPAYAGNKNLSWSSSNPAVAAVGENGLVTAIAQGSATITVRSAEGGYTDACSVMVGAAQGISLSFSDKGQGVFSQDTFTLIQGGTPASQTIYLADPWTGGEWRVDGLVKDSGTNSFEVKAADYTRGKHTLQVTVRSGGIYWSETIQFTVQ